MKNEEKNWGEETFEVRDIRKKGVFILEDEFFNGYARILSPYILSVYVCLCRHVDKDQKCWPSQQQMAEELGISDTTIREAIKVLEFFRFIQKQRIGKGCNNRYWLLDKKHWRKDFEVIIKSLCSPEHKEFMVTTQTLLVKNIKSLCSNSKETHIKETHSKDIIITDTSTNEKNGSTINSIISLFKEVNPSYQNFFARKYQRSAVERMLKSIGEEKLKQLIKFLPQTNQMDYAPTITSPFQLEEKMASLINFLQKQKNKGSKVITI
jgi:predicted transcriptional regulator